jgi:hypothetical protein
VNTSPLFANEAEQGTRSFANGGKNVGRFQHSTITWLSSFVRESPEQESSGHGCEERVSTDERVPIFTETSFGKVTPICPPRHRAVIFKGLFLA